jgi:transcriptional regulator with XRE-family HTH domain
MELGQRLKAIRKAKGLPLKDVYSLTNEQVSVSFLSDIENGRGKPSIESLKIIAKALNTPVSYFIDDADNNLLGSAIEDTDLLPIIELLRDFKAWNIEDKKELLYYLKAKKAIRDNK